MTEAGTGRERLTRLAMIGLLVNVALAGAKLIAGLVGHSYALVADAVESMVDIVGSFVIWAGLRYAQRPADDDHPYGHGRAESLAALAVAGLVAIAGVGIAVKAIDEILTPHHAPAPWTLLVLVVVVIAKETMARVVSREARRAGSSGGEADAGHHRSDAITSLAAFVGIGIAVVGGPGYEPADDWAALLASGIILWNAWKLARRPIDDLLDRRPDALVTRSETLALGVAGVVNVQKTLARSVGAGFVLEMHVRVPGTMSVREAHRIGHMVKDAIRADEPQVRDVLVHLEPAEPAGA